MSNEVNIRPHRRRAGWWWISSTAVLATLWILFFLANMHAWGQARRPVGMGAMPICLQSAAVSLRF